MQFYEHIDYYQRLKRHTDRLPDADRFYNEMLRISQDKKDIFTYRQSLLEKAWITNRKPYYNVYPAIHPMVTRLTLNIPCSALSVPKVPLALRLPYPPDNPYLYDGKHVKTVLFGSQEVASAINSNDVIEGMVLAFDIGELDELNNPIYSFKIFPLRSDMTIEGASEVLPHHRSIHQGVQINDSTIRDMIKLCSVICLIGDDPDLITPDVLAKDRLDYARADANTRLKMVQKARQKGKNGYNLGADLHLIPHYRRPHLAIVHTGAGRSVPKVVMRRGSVVHREKIQSIPTGFIDG